MLSFAKRALSDGKNHCEKLVAKNKALLSFISVCTLAEAPRRKRFLQKPSNIWV